MHKAAFYATADEELLFSQLSDTEIILWEVPEEGK